MVPPNHTHPVVSSCILTIGGGGGGEVLEAGTDNEHSLVWGILKDPLSLPVDCAHP